MRGFRKFIPDYVAIAYPLSNLLRAGVKFWRSRGDAFERLKRMLSEEAVLSLYWTGAETELHTDTSALEYSAIQFQRGNENNLFHPVYYLSEKRHQLRLHTPAMS